jgi:hypothetical protein
MERDMPNKRTSPVFSSTTILGIAGDVNGDLDIPQGLDGDATANRCARFLWHLIKFCNDHDIPIDCHYILWSEDDFLEASDTASP